MKRTLCILALLFSFMGAWAQTSQEDFLRRYNNLIERVGPAGVGVETLIDRWAQAYPDDPQQLLARFSFCFTKSRTSVVIIRDTDRYLGAAPLIASTDSTGHKRNFFEDYDYDDDLYAEANLAIDRAIQLCPLRLDYRFLKTAASLAYEKESPDITLQSLLTLIQMHYTEHPQWVYEGVDNVDDECFEAFIQQYCHQLFTIGSPTSAEAFRTISETMLRYSRDNPLFMNNLGSYQLVFKHDNKKALKLYNAVLRKYPGDLTAIRNCIILARNSHNVRLEKKYLAMMVQYGATDTDKASAQARLDALNGRR